MKKVAIVERLQTEKLKVPVPLWLERSGEALKIEVPKLLVQYLQVDCASDEFRKILFIPEIRVLLSDSLRFLAGQTPEPHRGDCSAATGR